MIIVAEPGQSLVVGSVVAETYQVTRLLGRGGMGAVWEASHLRLPGKRVAIKVLHTDVATDQEALARFRREAEIATRLDHPNIVEVHDFNSLPDGQPYLVLELLLGESLDARIRRGPIPPDQVVRIAGQIAGALSAAHRAGVVHRDLKPQNVFLVPREDEVGGELVKVLDFGISKIRGSQTVKTNDSTLLGTPQYMAPEQAIGNHAAVDPRTDVFALGAILYEMLAGRPAFSGQNIPEVVYKVVYEPAPPLAALCPGLPPRMVQAVERALAKKQDERFPDVAAFIEQLAGMSISTLRRQPVLQAPVSPSVAAPDGAMADPLAATVDSGRRERSTLPPQPDAATVMMPRSRRGLWIGLATVMLAVAVVVAIVLAGRGDGGEPVAATPPPAPAPSAAAPTAEDARKLAAQAIGEELMAAQAEAGDDDGEDGEEDPGEDGEEDPGEETATPRAAPAPRKSASAPTPPPTPPAPPGAAKSKTPRSALERLGPSADAVPDAADATVSDDVRSDLIAAEAAIRGGDYREALYRAERATRDGGGAAAYTVMARAHCAMDNVGGAAAALRHIPARRVVLRRAVRAFCAARGHELEE